MEITLRRMQHKEDKMQREQGRGMQWGAAGVHAVLQARSAPHSGAPMPRQQRARLACLCCRRRARAGTASQFQEMEQTVYNSLFTLIKDTSVLRDYAAAALLIVNVSARRSATAGPGHGLAATAAAAGSTHGQPC